MKNLRLISLTIPLAVLFSACGGGAGDGGDGDGDGDGAASGGSTATGGGDSGGTGATNPGTGGDTTEPLPGPCTDGDFRQVDCNICQCEDGGWQCSEIACPGPETGGSSGAGGDGNTGRACSELNPCSETEYCDYPEEDPCGAMGSLGTCKERPAACVGDPTGAFLCGCDDGEFYASQCQAYMAGTDYEVCNLNPPGPMN